MNEIISDFFSTCLTEEQAENFADILNLCQYLGVPTAEDEIIAEIVKQERVGIPQVIDNIYNKFNILLFTLGRIIGIHFDIDSEFRDRLMILQATMELDNLGDVDEALDIIEYADGEHTSTLARLLAYTTTLTEDEFEIAVTRVTTGLIDNLKKVFLEKRPALDDDAELDEAVLNIAKVYKAFRTYRHDEMGIMRDYIINGFPLNMKFQNYFAQLQKDHDRIKDDDMALAAVIIAIISKGTDDLNAKIDVMTEYYSDNPGIAMRIRVQANKIATDFLSQLHRLGNEHQ